MQQFALSARLSWLRRDIDAAIDGASRCPAALERLRRARAEVVAALRGIEGRDAGKDARPVERPADGDVRDFEIG